MSDPEPTLECVVTRYSCGQVGSLVELVSTERTGYWVERDYLFLGNSAASGPVEQLLERAQRGRGWLAQAGTPPVYTPPCPHPEAAPECCGRTCELPNGGWGGRNYPEIRVEAHELVRVLAAAGVTT